MTSTSICLGFITVKQYHNSPSSKVLKLQSADDFDVSALPDIIPPPGLSKERQAYLFNEIRQFVDVDKRDRVCPAPGMFYVALSWCSTVDTFF